LLTALNVDRAPDLPPGGSGVLFTRVETVDVNPLGRRKAAVSARLEKLLRLPYSEDQRSDDPEQYRLIGFADGQLTTFIVEYRADEWGLYIWVVTAWRSTRQEANVYEQTI
jgi:hypothetical protein